MFNTYSEASELNCGEMADSLDICQRFRYLCRHGREEQTLSMMNPARSSISNEPHVVATHFYKLYIPYKSIKLKEQITFKYSTID